jgi:hypothetical protein
MSRFEFRLPDIGEGIAEAEIVAWHVKVGDEIGEDQQLADLMTDKATVEMESPVAGKVIELAGEVGDQVAIGSVLAVIETAGADRAAEPVEDSKDERPLADGAVMATPAMAEEIPVTKVEERPLPLAGGEKPRSAEGVGASDTPTPQPPPASGSGSTAFYLGGGYKYAMAGEGCAFMHAPPGFGPRPRITGWFAEFEDLSLPPGSVGYARDATRFLGATFDPSGLYRFNAVQRMLQENSLTAARISTYVAALQQQLLDATGETPLADAELLNPLDGGPHARFLAFRSANAPRWYAQLKAQNCITDVRGDVLRIGFGIYQDEDDVEMLLAKFGALS